MVIKTPAKINLVLDVLAKRADGYHEIRSLMMPVGLYDEMTIQPSPTGEMVMTCSHPGVPTDSRNLIYQAAEILGKHLARNPGCIVHLEKLIPVAGGMGGGSSNAAGALLALNELWAAGLSRERLAAIGAEVGSDVPFFFAGAGAIVSGRGECVEPVQLAFSGWVLLVLGGVPVSTAQVYARCTPRSPERQHIELGDLVGMDRAERLRGHLRNALEPAVFEVAPAMHALSDRIRAACGRKLCVSGAGAVLFDLFDTESEARLFAARLRSAGITEPIRIVCGPVAQ